MKKIKYLFVVCLSAFLLTGCVKYNVNMDIKKDKSMDLKIIYAINTSMMGEADETSITNADKLEEQGFTVTEYDENNMNGFKIEKKIKNIDEVSTKDEVIYDLSFEDDNKYMFQIKKGFFKNTYKAKFLLDSSSTVGDDYEESGLDLEVDDLYDPDDNYSEDPDGDFIIEGSDDEGEMDLSSITGYSEMLSNMDMSINVTLPYSAIKSNASVKENNDKTLKWNLSLYEENNIEFEFSLYNLTRIYIAGGILLLLVIIIVVYIIKRKNNTGSNPKFDETTGIEIL